MTSIVIRKAGICSTLQDPGRTGYRAFGVPGSGALDAVALSLANQLVGNAPDRAGIEMLYSGTTFEVVGDAVRLVLCGSNATIIGSDAATRRVLAPWESAIVRQGETLRVHSFRETATAYLVIEGGFAVEPVMGSVSTYLKSTLGGWKGRALRAGDVLPLELDQPTARGERRYARLPDLLQAPARLRVMLGPQENRFERISIETLLTNEYTVSRHSDRAGLRLEGPPLRHVDGHDATSAGVAAGSIQIPGSGLPVILFGDHPTVGGYPKIATIISADLAAAGRLRIGSRVQFSAVSAAEAADARAQLRATTLHVLASMAELRK